MSVLTIAERVGKKEGRKEGLHEAISDILEIKFGAAGLQLAKQAKKITSLATLQKIRMGLKQARSIEEAEALMKTYLQKKYSDGQRN